MILENSGEANTFDTRERFSEQVINDVFTNAAGRKLETIFGDFGLPDEDRIVYSVEEVKRDSVEIFNEEVGSGNILDIIEKSSSFCQNYKNDDDSSNQQSASTKLEKDEEFVVSINRKYKIETTDNSTIKVPEGCKYKFLI
jgi:hypothetical protein